MLKLLTNDFSLDWIASTVEFVCRLADSVTVDSGAWVRFTADGITFGTGYAAWSDSTVTVYQSDRPSLVALKVAKAIQAAQATADAKANYPAIPVMLTVEEKDAADKGNKITAIKMVRERFRDAKMGLKDAKDSVEFYLAAR